jgi:hypothetical protein
MNAAIGVGRFEISIARPSGPQKIVVRGLMPEHDELIERPGLVHLICRGKRNRSRRVRSSEIPDWCRKRQ